MSKLRVHCFSISLDGYSAGPKQDRDNPVGVGGLPVFGWQFATRTHHQMSGKEGGETGLDDDMVARGFENIGAWIMGRNMFGPIRGPWIDESWKGWWRHPPVPHTGICANPSSPRLHHNAGRNDLPLRDRRHTSRPGTSQRCCAWKGRQARWGDRNHKAISARRLGGRDAFCDLPALIGSGERLFPDLNLPASAINSPVIFLLREQPTSY